MRRLLLSPRWLPLHLLALAAVVGMVLLGGWQLDRVRDSARPLPLPGGPPVPLAEVLAPEQSLPAAAVGRPVTARGRYDAARALLVPGRARDGRDGAWSVVPLRTPDAAMPVVRGWVPAGAPTPPVPAGDVRVTGRLQPSEAPAVANLPPGEVASVNTPTLASLLEYPIYDGFVLAADETPPPAAPLARVAPQPPTSGLSLRNAAYALQWWLFAGFALFLWWRVLRDGVRPDARRHRPLASPG